MLVLSWVGSYWQEPNVASTASEATRPFGPSVETSPSRGFYRVAVAAIVGAVVWQPVDTIVNRGQETSVPTIAPIAGAKGWVASQTQVPDFKPRYSGYAADLRQSFENGDRKVGL